MAAPTDKGQALFELIIVLPFLLSLGGALGLLLVSGALRLEILSLSQELRVCYESTQSESFCKRHFRQALSELPGGWQWRHLEKTHHGPILELEHSLPFLRNPWQIPL